MSTYTFKWPKGPEDVIVTGSFDNWSKTLPLVKQADGSFEITAPLPPTDDKVLYKYVVDGDWLVSPSQKITADAAGNDNNYIDHEDFAAFAAASGSAIPEAGGLISHSINDVKHDELKTTVLPSTEGQQATIAGEPGIQIPANKAAFATFEAPRPTVIESKSGETKTVGNGEAVAADEKSKKKLKRSQYKSKKAAGAEDTSSGSALPAVAAVGAAGAAAAASIAAIAPSDEYAAAATTTSSKAPVAEAENKTSAAAVAESEPTAAELIEESHKYEYQTEEVKELLNQEIEADVPLTAPIVDITEPTAAELVESVHENDHAADELKEEVNAEIKAEVPVTAAVDETPVTLDPSHVKDAAVAPAEVEREVDAAPVEKSTDHIVPTIDNDSEDEIVIAHGSDSAQDIAAAIAAQEGADVTVEEIKPTTSEAERLTNKANKQTKAEAIAAEETAATASTTPEGAAIKGAAIRNKKAITEGIKDTKKKSGLSRFFRKVFKSSKE